MRLQHLKMIFAQIYKKNRFITSEIQQSQLKIHSYDMAFLFAILNFLLIYLKKKVPASNNKVMFRNYSDFFQHWRKNSLGILKKGKNVRLITKNVQAHKNRLSPPRAALERKKIILHTHHRYFVNVKKCLRACPSTGW